MTVFLGILVALLVFFSVVIFHELGHFLAARKFGVKVEEFGIGIPPKACVLTKDRKGCEYTLNYLPIGGFVRLKGEDETLPESAAPDSFVSKGYFARSTIILAGVAFNFVFAFILFFLLFLSGVQPLAINSKFETVAETLLIPTPEKAVEIGLLKVSGVELSPLAASPAEKAGIVSGDVVESINGKRVATPQDFIEALRLSVAEKLPADISVIRSGAALRFSVVPENGKIGSYVSYANPEYVADFRYRFTPSEAFFAAGTETWAQTRFTFEMLGKIVGKLAFPVKEGDRQEAAEGVGGPIAIGGLFVKLVSAQAAISVIIAVAALLSINLGAFNLLPIPALDGGRFFLMTLIEPFRRTGRIEFVRRVEALIHQFGFVFFLFLAVIIAFHDVSKFFR